MSGIAVRLAQLRAMRSLSVKELCAMTGISQADLMAVEHGRRKRLSPDLLHRLADLFTTTDQYLLEGEEPSGAALKTGFFRFYERLSLSERKRLKYAPIQDRVELALHFLETSYPDLFDRQSMAARLGYTPAALEDVLRGAAPLQSHLLRLLASLLGLTKDFFVRGDFFGGAEPGEQIQGPARLNDYYEVVQEAIAANVSPDALRKAVRILALREREE